MTAPESRSVPVVTTIKTNLQRHFGKRVSILSKAENRFTGVLTEVDLAEDELVAVFRKVHVCVGETQRHHMDDIWGETFETLALKLSQIKAAVAHLDVCSEMHNDLSIMECSLAIMPILVVTEESSKQVGEPVLFSPLDFDCQQERDSLVDAATAVEFLNMFLQEKSLVSFVSKAQIRYEGVLHAINSTNGSVSLTSVCMMGTEDRPCERFIPAREEIYAAVRFTLSEMHDMKVFLRMNEELRRDPILGKSFTVEPLVSCPHTDRSKNLGCLRFSVKVLERIRAAKDAKQRGKIAKSDVGSSQPQFTTNGNSLALQIGDLHESSHSIRIPILGKFQSLLQETRSRSTGNGQVNRGNEATSSNQVTPGPQKVEPPKKKRGRSKKIQEQFSADTPAEVVLEPVRAKRGRK